jgi:hypothetical protein
MEGCCVVRTAIAVEGSLQDEVPLFEDEVPLFEENSRTKLLCSRNIPGRRVSTKP